jgi:hypothetical protein
VITRRRFLLSSGALAGASGVGVRLAASIGESQPVVAYFDGQLWLDTSGASVAYRAPTGARVMPSFTDEELIRARGYL